MSPDVTEFTIRACGALGCDLRAATSTAELAALDVWLRFSLTGVVSACVEAMDPGNKFTAVDVIAYCRLVNPQAIIT